MLLCGLLQGHKLSRRKKETQVDQPESGVAQEATTARYLPLEVWAMISQHVTPREWARVCGTCPTAYKLRRLLVVAEVRDWLSNNEQGFMRQLQMDKWSACHSLCFNLRRIYEPKNVNEARIRQIQQAGSLLPQMQCLHIIGCGDHIVNAEDSLQALLVNVLAGHVSVLTLDVHMLGVPLNTPNLQHLVLHLVPSLEIPSGALFPAIMSLKSLKTLYVQSDPPFDIRSGPLDLRGCAQLQHVALQNVYVAGALALPAGCFLHVFGVPMVGGFINCGHDDLVSGLTLRHYRNRTFTFSSGEPLFKWAPTMQHLKLLRLTLSREMLSWHSLWRSMHIDFTPGKTPCLEVLELDVHSSLSIHIDPNLPLRSIIVVAAGHLALRNLSDPVASCPVSRDTLKQLYFQSGAPLCRAYNVSLERYYTAQSGPGAQMRLLKCYEGGRSGWTLQMPTSFTPRNLQGCCRSGCSACPECLVRAGVPILCDRAWTSDGFDERLRQHCS